MTINIILEKCYDLLGETEVNNYFIVNKKDVAIYLK